MDEARKKELVEQLLGRGVENIIPSREVLYKKLMGDGKLNIYLGIDPTATRIHLGHAFPLRKLAILAELGHNVTFLIGDFTAKIGDTSDKDTERPVLTDEQIEENFQTYKRQAEKFLDFAKVELRHNSEWLSKLGFDDVVRLTRHFSLNDFISRELIKKRLSEGKSVSLPEVLYPVMQGYDSYFMNTDIQLGGTDQTFNMQAGRTLIKNMRDGKESCIIANGFLPGTDGRKMSKSWGNAIWIEDAPEEIFGKVMSIKDDLIVTYFEMGTNLSEEKIVEVKEKLGRKENPMELKRELGREVVRELCGEGEVEAAEEYFNRTVVKKEVSVDAPVVKVDVMEMGVMTSENGASLMDIVVGANVVASNGEFKRLLQEGAIYLNEERVKKEAEVLKLKMGENVVRVGRRKYLKIIK